MERQEFIKKLSKYSKEAILTTVCNMMFFRLDKFVKEIEWNDIQLRFDKLMLESEKISKQMNPLIDKKDFKSFQKYIALMNKDSEIHKKIDSVMKEMGRHNKRLEGANEEEE